MSGQLGGTVVAVHRRGEYGFSKDEVDEIELVAGLGVADDAHQGAQVQHRSRVKADPTQPNLRQVHFIATELFDEVRAEGFEVEPGDLGENVTTTGLDLLNLPVGSTLLVGTALVTLTGTRNPCGQIDGFQKGLRAAVMPANDDGSPDRRAGAMGVVVRGGVVRAGDSIVVALPPEPHHRLERV